MGASDTGTHELLVFVEQGARHFQLPGRAPTRFNKSIPLGSVSAGLEGGLQGWVLAQAVCPVCSHST